jgi:uncharacterized protein YyaL (SSP411 family)
MFRAQALCYQGPGMLWHDWSETAFAAARERGVPVLLFVRAPWCRWCREMERRVFRDPRVDRLVNERFVALRVDKDRRPDIDARYSKGGWPTVAWLDDAGELLGADNFLEPDDFVARLELVSDAYARNRDAIRARLAQVDVEPALGREGRAPTGAAATLSISIIEQAARTLLETADPVHGGWGREQKFPHPEALDFLLIRWSQTGDPEVLAVVRRTLRKMEEGEIHDTVEGGFYRYATHADWSGPNHEKMLESNALRLHAYLEAFQALGDESFRRTSQGILAWMQSTLLDRETRAFRGSQDASPTYAHLPTVAARRAVGAPDCDPTIFANWNAIAVRALLKASTVLREHRHREQALAALDFVLESLYDERNGVYHYWDGSFHLPGMLTDQAYVLRALIDAVQFAGENRYLPIARKLADLTIERHRSESGGFYDTLHDPGARGGLRRRQISILENSVMAEALLRLSHLLRDDDYADAARAALQSFVTDYKRFGHFVAGYARAVDLVVHEPVHVTIVGPRSAEATRALREAALRPYVASRIVQVIDPVEDVEFLDRFGLPGPRTLFEPARAYVHRAKGSYAETADPTRLAALMTRTERGE